MIPSLVESEVRTALVDYLATTFSLCDDDVTDALAAFLTDPDDGIFRGPYLRVRTPFRTVGPDWVSPLGWLPEGFVPYLHQATAFARLSTAAGREPRSTLVTTGTGSGKTECFLMPILDHVARRRAAGHKGIKALILYPMNALASDQAGRLASMIHEQPHLSGVTAGIYIGENGPNRTMEPDGLIDDRHAMRSSPPDILLTNYKMLDMLVLRREDHDLWADNGPDTLRYVVLDEFHTYDGAQGTDVAMLLRRLGATLGMATDSSPLGRAVAVATSATLGSDASAVADLRDFAGKVFGVDFDDASVIGESRQSIDEACGAPDDLLPVPSAHEVAGLPTDDLDPIAAVFCGRSVTDSVELGSLLLGHRMTRALLRAVSQRPRSYDETISEMVATIGEWGDAARNDPATVKAALGRYLALISIARRRLGTRTIPLFPVEVQLWIREISRLLRTVDTTPRFSWMDTPTPLRDHAEVEDETGHDISDGPGIDELALPSVFCRKCGHSGWMATTSMLNDTLDVKAASIYRSAVERSPATKVMLCANVADPHAKHLDPLARRILDQPGEHTIPVHVSTDEDDVRSQRCPACAERDSIRFLGLAVASLASVSINTMFGSPNVSAQEQKLLAFTDSVQDASHRAAFFGGRTHRFNLRSLMSASLQQALAGNGGTELHAGGRGVNLADLGDDLLAGAATARERHGLVPPDLLRDPIMRSVWSDEPLPDALEVLRRRIGFEVDLEFGLRSGVGRTLERSAAAATVVELGDTTMIGDLVTEAVRDVVGELDERTVSGVDGYVLGLIERLRTSGAINNVLLDPYVTNDGRQWFIWGGRPHGLPPFTPDQSRPTFATAPLGGTSSGSAGTKGPTFDDLSVIGTNPTWYLDWAMRSLALGPSVAATVNRQVLGVLAETTDAVTSTNTGGGRVVYGLDRRAVHAVDIADQDGVVEASVVRCDACSGLHTVAPALHDKWIGTPCRRYRCPGRYVGIATRDPGYYRRFYRQGRTRRVVTGEHTGLLSRRDREELENAFKDGTAPDAPNVLTATPTLEMGIDIGDLSAVMLTSVPRNPASYIQRIGRAGRATGNSLVTTFVRSDSHGLYYMTQPEAMLAGEVRPPNCYLEATETLRRQYTAYLLDRIADGAVDAPPPPRTIGELMRDPFAADGVFRSLVDASADEHHVERFIALFGDRLGARAREGLRAFARGGVEEHLRAGADTWFERRRELERRRERIGRSIKRLEASGAITGPVGTGRNPSGSGPLTDEDHELRTLTGERSAVIELLRQHRGEYWISALERLGILPNYTLVDDTTVLTSSLWSRSDEGYSTRVTEYPRAGRVALAEFAPGNTFYAGGYRHHIDALEIGSASEPLYEPWRICPDCQYATPDSAEGTPTTCKRCGGSAIADAGTRHTVLRMRAALSSGSEEDARVLDESDERTRQRYDIVTLVDPDPEEISGAWLLEDRTFGAELCTRTHLRSFNLGMSERPGESVLIAGDERHVSRFTTCRHCGAVREARNDMGGRRPERLHHGWCKVRSGSEAERWDQLVLLHELTTESIRFLVPVSMFEVDERLASFKAALLLGLRAELGGDLDHLTITTAHSPNRNGQGRRRFLVLYDQVPGGTGYLAPLADPDRVHEILVAARRAVATCECRHEGLRACHRCLLGVVGRHEYDLVDRALAKNILDSLLADWHEPTFKDTIGDASIAKVEESELERRFKVAIREWAENETDAAVNFKKIPAEGKREAFELSIGFQGQVVRYRITEQPGISTTPSTTPDFLITRMDGPGREVAVYLDGFQYHASSDHNNIAADSARRHGVRHEGYLVWNLTWTDVETFHAAVTAEPTRRPPDRPLLDPRARERAQRVQHEYRGNIDVRAVEQNPMALLLDYLVRPDFGDWRRVVISAITGMAASGGFVQLDPDALTSVLDDALAGRRPTPPTAPAGGVVAASATYTTPNGLPITVLLDMADPNAEQWTALAVLPDDDASISSPDHQARWADWLAVANLVQFLGLPHQSSAGVMAGSSQAKGYDHDDLWLRDIARSGGSAALTAAVAAPDDAPTVTLVDDQLEELDLLVDEVRGLARTALEAGHSGLVAGYEVDGTPLEAAWPERHVAILVGGTTAPTGWDARSVTGWTVESLLEALSGSDGPITTEDTEGS